MSIESALEALAASVAELAKAVATRADAPSVSPKNKKSPAATDTAPAPAAPTPPAPETTTAPVAAAAPAAETVGFVDAQRALIGVTKRLGLDAGRAKVREILNGFGVENLSKLQPENYAAAKAAADAVQA